MTTITADQAQALQADDESALRLVSDWLNVE